MSVSSQPISQKIIFIVGPTAVGKTEAGLEIARRLKGEIISCDSMQVYKEINIASSKPPVSVLKKIKHHLVDIVSIEEEFDVAVFAKKATAVIEEICHSGKVPLVVGGSGLYMKVLLDGIFSGPACDEDIRRSLEIEAGQRGNEYLHDRLKDSDPVAAAKIHPRDKRRIIRALEVAMIADRPISQLQKDRGGLWGKYDVRIFALNRPRPQLYDLINKRVDVMFQEGIVGEIERLRERNWSRTAQSIIGVKEILGYLNGEYDLERAKYLIKLKTRHFAKRQLTWFRADARIQWLMIDQFLSLSGVAEKILEEAAIG